MQMAFMQPYLSSTLVPSSTRPIWHQWNQQSGHEINQQQPAQKCSARRRLFQEEADNDGEDNQQYVKRLLAQFAEHYKQKWNFDFDEGRPLEDGQYHYEAVPASQVPGFYRMRQSYGKQQEKMVANKSEEEERDENQWVAGKSAENSDDGMAEEEEADEAENAVDIGMKSPTRAALRKPKKSQDQTPKRRSGGQQTKLTDYLSTRKSLPRSATKKLDDSIGGVQHKCHQQEQFISLSVESPTKRRRHSEIPMASPSPIKKANGANGTAERRRSQRLSRMASELLN